MFGVHEVADVYFIDLVTNKPVLYFDTLKVSTLETAAETSHATGGKGNARLLSWDFGRTAKFNMTDALLDPKAIAAYTGNALVTGATPIYRREILTVVDGTLPADDKVTLTKTPIAGSVTVFKLNGDDLGDEVTGVTVAALEAKWVDANGPGIGARVMAFYQYTSEATAQLIKLTTDKFPGYYRVVGDTLIRNESTGVDEPFQIVIEKAKLMPSFNITLEAAGDPGVFAFDVEAYKPANSNELVRMIKY